MNRKIITIDGGVATGKTTISKKLAEKLNINFLPTGKLYRLATLICIKNSFSIDQLIEFLSNKKIELIDANFYIENFDYKEEDIFAVDKKILKELSCSKEVRNTLTNIFRKIVSNIDTDFIVEGRDASTNIFPSTKYKFFLKVDIKEAALRRKEQFSQMGIEKNIDYLIEEIKNRNLSDSSREFDPLKISPDSIIIDTTNLTLDEIINIIIKEIHET